MKILKLLESDLTINWDRRDGVGAVPDQSNINYLGFERLMLPMEFRALVPSGVWNRDTTQFIIDKIKKGEPIAPPFLIVEWDVDSNTWTVMNHEGRSRVDAAISLGINTPIAISMLPRLPRGELRARNITDEMRTAKIHGQIGSPDASKSF